PKTLREDSAIQNRRYTDSGFRIRGAVGNEGGSSSLLEEAFFSELRVMTMKTKKYSTLKTTTTTAYPHHAVSPSEDSTRS
ncbi:hypothetical protein N9081_05185, partial [Akkermansiaceae bacterium]|nr:hypothetical protein [Akkermansiaceae bacterium]